jgi:hypothetical protein
MSDERKYSFSYGSPATEKFVDVTEIVYSTHVVNGKIKFSEEEDLDVYFGDPVPGLPKQLVVRNKVSGGEKRFWQRSPISMKL